MTTLADMSTPVTRGELREELAQLEGRFDRKLELWGGALWARVETRFEAVEARFEARFEAVETRIEAVEQRMLAELARHTNAILEAVSKQISVIDEKYADLPARVSRLEAAPARRRPRGR